MKDVAHLFITKYKTSEGHPPSGLLFNKFMVLTNYRLLEQNIDMKLPHCWYRWGDEVVRYPMMSFTQWNAEDLNYTSVDWKGAEPVSYNSTVREQSIGESADRFIADYRGKEGVESVIDEVYYHAPYPFQVKYKDYRTVINNALAGTMSNHEVMQIMQTKFALAMDAFPTEFAEIRREAENFRLIAETAMVQSISVKDLRYMSEDFWFFFCYYLRLKQHWNVTDETLVHWKEPLMWEREKFQWELQDLAFKYAAEAGTESLNRLVADRRVRMERSDRILDLFSDSDYQELRAEAEPKIRSAHDRSSRTDH